MTAPPYAKGHMVRIALDLASPPVEATLTHLAVYPPRPWAPFFRNDKHKPSIAGIDAYECNPYGVKAMTNENISGFLNSIAEAKRAFDAEPEHLQRIADLEADQRRLGETVAARELRIHSLKQDNDALLGKLRSVEAERDDAGFRHLEADDKVQSL